MKNKLTEEIYRKDRSGDKLVASGTWFYDGTVPMRIQIYAKLPRFARKRYEDHDQIDGSRPIPETKDGFLYYCEPVVSDEYLTIEDAKAWADSQPWGPVTWDF